MEGQSMIKIIPVDSLSEIQAQREIYMHELPYSQELNTEENVWECQHFKIHYDSTWIGYACISSNKTLWQFYLMKSAGIHAQEIFRTLIDQGYIKAAECISFDHLLMSLCMDFHQTACCSAYVFRDDSDANYPFSSIGHIHLRQAKKEDFDILSEISGDFFYNLEDHIQKKEVVMFYSDDELLGAGTCKKIFSSLNYYDIGMVVADKHRNKGIGTLIVTQMKKYCYDHDLIPVCGCWYPNLASKRTLEKAGFIAKHRVIRFEF
jgi:RimJ/RimL family protein N-acetyltransferase